jgi:predicted DNA-binding mobile mystery protein A
LKTIQQVAEAMDCMFVYSVVPLTSLDETLRDQDKKVAIQRLSGTSNTMLLEDQMLSNGDWNKMLHAKVEDLIRDQPKGFRSKQ